MKIKDIIDNYLFESSLYKKTSTYSFDLKVSRSIQRCLYFLNIQYVNELNKNVLFDMIIYYRTQTKKKNSGINQTIEWLYSVFNYFEVKHNMGKFRKLVNDTESFKHFKDTELKSILKYVKVLPDVNNNIMYRLAVFLLLDTGLRTNELLNLLVKNVDFDEQSILVEKTKNGKRRYVYFSELSKDTLSKVISKTKSPYIFENLLSGSNLTSRALRYFLDKMKKDLRFDKLHAHQFRKTFAMGLLKNGAGLEVIQKLLGHSDIKMTMVYLDVYDYYVASEYKRFQPKY